MEALVEQLLQSPKLHLYLSQIQGVITEEQRRREEFYERITEQQKAEFINGQVVFHSPVMKRHNSASGKLYQLMNVYAERNGRGFVGIEKILISLTRNDYEPDICFFSETKARHFTEDQMRFPAPDLIVEVLSDSTAKVDRGLKFEDYEAHGVAEYWIIDPQTQVVEQYLLQADHYQLQFKSDNGLVRSRALLGFEIPVQTIFDEQINTQALQAMLRTGTA